MGIVRSFHLCNSVAVHLLDYLRKSAENVRHKRERQRESATIRGSSSSVRVSRQDPVPRRQQPAATRKQVRKASILTYCKKMELRSTASVIANGIKNDVRIWKK